MNATMLLQDFQHATGIPVALYHGGRPDAVFPDTTFAPNYAYHLLRQALAETPGSFVFHVSPDFVIAGAVRAPDGSLWVAGPVLEYRGDRATALRVLADLREPAARADELAGFLARVPGMSFGRFIRLLALLHLVATGERPSEDARLRAVRHFAPTEAVRPSKPLPASSEEYERRLLAAIEFGRTVELLDLLRDERAIAAGMGAVANAELRPFRNVFVMGASFASRAAVRGGVGFAEATEAADDYVRRMEALTGFTEVYELWRRMLIDFTERAGRCRRLNPASRLVREVSAHVDARLGEKLTANGIAAALGYNRSYLCRRFAQDAGVTLTDFVHAQKVDEAKRLLLSTDRPIVDIATSLGFATQNHFQTVFRTVAGTTPGAYRTQGGR